MNIDAISNGIVIDHITAGRGMKLYELLGLDSLDCSVAIIKNVHSNKLGKKDIITIPEAEGEFGFFTAEMTEKEYRETAEKCGKVIKAIRKA